MKNKKWYQVMMAGVLSAVVFMTSVPAWGAEFSDNTAQEGIVQETPALDEGDVFSAPAAEAATEVAVNTANFPDAVFRNYILENFDTDKNNALSDAEIKAVTEINVKGLGIANLKGVERFTALKELNASDNKLKSVDLTKNTKLTYVNVSKNSLSGTLNLSKCTSMVYVVYSNNALTKVTMPDKKYLKKVDYIDASYNKFTSQANAGLSVISNSYLTALTEINASNNLITSFNCSGFEGILDLSNNKITTLSGGSEGYQAVAIYLEGKYNTLSKTSSVNFSALGNRVPQRLSCNSAVKSKITMVTPRLTASTDWSKINISVGSSSDDASYKLERKTGSGSYKVIKTWAKGELEDPEFGENEYTDTAVTPGASYTYRLTTTVKVQNRDKTDVDWSSSKTITAVAAPKAPSVTVKSSKAKTATVTWKAVSGASGYQVYYGTSKTSAKSAVTKGTTKLTVTKTGLTSKKAYYFRVRAYKKVNGKTYYGPWSSVKGVRAK